MWAALTFRSSTSLDVVEQKPPKDDISNSKSTLVLKFLVDQEEKIRDLKTLLGSSTDPDSTPDSSVTPTAIKPVKAATKQVKAEPKPPALSKINKAVNELMDSAFDQLEKTAAVREGDVSKSLTAKCASLESAVHNTSQEMVRVKNQLAECEGKLSQMRQQLLSLFTALEIPGSAGIGLDTIDDFLAGLLDSVKEYKNAS